MKIINLLSEQPKKEPEHFFITMMSSVPKRFIPRGGFPDIVLTDSLFHSFGYYFFRQGPYHGKLNEEQYELYKSKSAWAISVMPHGKPNYIILSLGDVLENKRIRPIEFTWNRKATSCGRGQRQEGFA